MAYRTAEDDIQRAKDLRKTAKGVHDASAKRQLERAADRLERRGATKASKLGRRGKRKASVSALPDRS